MIPVGPDISYEQDILFMIDASLSPEIHIYFDPSILRKQDPDRKTFNNILSYDELKDFAI